MYGFALFFFSNFFPSLFFLLFCVCVCVCVRTRGVGRGKYAKLASKVVWMDSVDVSGLAN